MKTVELSASNREGVRQKSELNKLRQEGRVPAVLYGGEENINFHVDEVAFSKLINTHEVYLIDLNIEGKVIPAVIREVQFHPVTDRPTHIDFMQVFEDKLVTIGIPVNVTGNSIGVRNGGKRRDKLRRLVVKAFPKDLPEQIDIDITNLRIGQSIKVQDLNIEGVEFLDTPNAVVVAVKTSRLAAKGDDELTDEEGEEETAEAAATEES